MRSGSGSGAWPGLLRPGADCRGLLAAAITVAALAVAAEVGAQLALLRAIRQDLRAGGRAA